MPLMRRRRNTFRFDEIPPHETVLHASIRAAIRAVGGTRGTPRTASHRNWEEMDISGDKQQEEQDDGSGDNLEESPATEESKAEEEVNDDARLAKRKLENDEEQYEHKGDDAGSIGGDEAKGAGIAEDDQDAIYSKGVDTKEVSGGDNGVFEAGLTPSEHNNFDGQEASLAETAVVPRNDGSERQDGERPAATETNIDSPPRASSADTRSNIGVSRISPATLAPEWPPYCDPSYRLPSELEVRVFVDGQEKNMSIKIERFVGKKDFQGGYRHKVTGRVFHHASTQFGEQKKLAKKTDHLRTRDTQTCRMASTTMQTTNECGTQVGHPLMWYKYDIIVGMI